MKDSSLHRIAVIFLIFEAALLFLPLIILGQSINWPASLSEPASINLPLILEQYGNMMTGYTIYLVYSLLFWPVAYLAGRVIVEGEINNVLFQIANAFAALSAIARSLGIVRWLFAMPVLAELYVDPNATAADKENISMLYEMLNAYAGGIGESLGVSLFAVIWLVLICLLIMQNKKWPNCLGYFGFIAAVALLSNLAEVIGIDMGAMITISVVLLHLWMLATAIVFWRKNQVA